MALLTTINPENISAEAANALDARDTARAIVYDADGNIALLHVTRLNYHKLPGGGVEESENTLTALQRECREELGCEIEVGDQVGEIIEYRGKFGLKQTSYCYTAKVAGAKGIPAFTDEEREKGFVIKWVPLEQAIQILETEKPDDYEGRFIVRRELVFLRQITQK